MVNIKRKITLYILTVMLAIFVLNPLIANCESSRVFDDADLFSQKEIMKLNDDANSLSDDYDMDIIIVTTNDANGKTSMEYADDYFDYNGFGVGQDRDGILFLIDMDNREAYISTSGSGIKYLTDQRIEDILDNAYDKGLANGDYNKAAKEFLSGTKKYLEGEKKSITFVDTIISLVGGFITTGGFFFSTKSKYKMKTPVKPLTFRNNSIINLASDENKLVDTITTHRIIPRPTPSNSSGGGSTTHTSSSGRTHGGGGKKF